MGLLIIMALGFLLLWVFAIRPARRRQTEQASLLEGLRPGVEIITAGGLYGTVQSVGEDVLTVEIAPGTRVQLARRAVAAVVPEEDEAEGAELEEAADEPLETRPLS